MCFAISVSASALTVIPPPKGVALRLRSVLCSTSATQSNTERHPLSYFFQIGCIAPRAVRQQVMPDDHSESVPLLPIPNRTVKRLHADDSADSRVKVGNRQAPQQDQKPRPSRRGFCVYGLQNQRLISARRAGAVHRQSCASIRAAFTKRRCRNRRFTYS